MEVFSRRSRVSEPSSSEALQTLSVVTPERLNSFFSSRLNELCNRFEEWSLPFTVIGRLGVVSPDSWRRYEPLPLIDLTTQSEIGLEVPLSILEKTGLRGGDIVQAVGFLRARLVKGQVVLRFETLGLCLYEEKNRESTQSGINMIELLRELPAEKHSFPQSEGLSLLLVNLGVSRQKFSSFRDSLGALWQERAVRTLDLTPDDRQKFLQSLLTGTEDIIVILSGKESIALLEDAYALKALSACKAYRILVLENEVSVSEETGEKGPELKSLASHLVDRFFVSSVAAGRYIRAESSQAWQLREEERARQEEMNALRDSLTHFADLPDVSHNSGLWRGVLIGSLSGAAFIILCLTVFHFLKI